MSYSFHALSNHLLSLAQAIGEPLSPLKLQRLLFCAQVRHLSQHGAPLCDDAFVVWPTGPVLPALYHKCKAFGGNAVTARIPVAGPNAGETLFPVVAVADLATQGFLAHLMDTLGRWPASGLQAAVNGFLERAHVSQGATLDARALGLALTRAGGAGSLGVATTSPFTF